MEPTISPTRPLPLCPAGTVSNGDVFDDAVSFAGKEWAAVRAVDFERAPNCFFGFTPEAFAYYLPALIRCSEAENRPDLQAVDAIIEMLDISGIEYADEFVLSRWYILTAQELDDVRRWLHWLRPLLPSVWSPSPVERALTTLEALTQKKQNSEFLNPGF